MMENLASEIAKGISAFGGAAAALLYTPPKTRAEAARRFFFAWFIGYIGSDVVREEFLHWPDRGQNGAAAAALVALACWTLWGAVIKAVVKLLEMWKPKG